MSHTPVVLRRALTGPRGGRRAVVEDEAPGTERHAVKRRKTTAHHRDSRYAVTRKQVMKLQARRTVSTP